MDAIITGESERVGLSVIDNNDVEHLIEMNESGEIKYHEQDGYSDVPSDRTEEENEHVKQARRYARYHVFGERGYATVELAELPEWQVVVATAISQLDLESFEEHFGLYYQQLRAVVEGDVEPVVDVPEDDVAGLRVYLLNVHLGLDAESVLDDELLSTIERALATDADLGELIETVAEQLGGVQLGPDALSIAGVSDLGVLYQGATREVEQPGEDPHPGPADARLELSPTEVPGDGYLPLDGFQVLLVHHLLCQARDCYLQMGQEPPEGLRVLGLGKYRQTVRNEYLDLYPPVHSTTEPVEDYRLPEVGTHVDSAPG